MRPEEAATVLQSFGIPMLSEEEKEAIEIKALISAKEFMDESSFICPECGKWFYKHAVKTHCTKTHGFKFYSKYSEGDIKKGEPEEPPAWLIESNIKYWTRIVLKRKTENRQA